MTILKATEEDIRFAYRLLLGRQPDPAGLAHFSALLRGDGISPKDLAEHFMQSPEFYSAHPGLFKDIGSSSTPPDSPIRLTCSPCTMEAIDSPVFRFWANQLKDLPGRPHRKLWEWCFIAQALYERNVLRKGSRGLGFAVGQEPLTALFASRGCTVVATDLDQHLANREGWVEGNQHAAGLEQLNMRGICPEETLRNNVSFRSVDMREIPTDLRGFDFLWSSCALEHLGSLENGVDFVESAMKCLVPGGIAVHTTELNCDSNDETIEKGHDVIYRQRDLLRLVKTLEQRGHRVSPMNFSLGKTESDLYVDEVPYKGMPHIRLRIGKFSSTSFGLIVIAGDS
ncbi:MAG TPA: DUF4214 domain-containing protein [Dokdonella sp.]|uniref:DUF4214 domain-containing protein n=1 Tax=Dokdonella sp. TaxID=2291710 RepID=UPI002D7F3DE5|nr:DUF4214 domain-containing protein [Dokdonella sp.]HET9034514.1 DUF4214 domain-containing protein [Dokdonella sp.]